VTLLNRFFAIAALASVPACHSGARPQVAAAPASPESAVQAFLAAADSNALNRMAALWGDENGPPTDRRILREREQRMQIMQRVLQHDAIRIVPNPGAMEPPAGRRLVFVEFQRGSSRVTVPFTVVAQRRGGWLVEKFDIELLMPGALPQRPRTP
jgi:hypothetical protein